MDDRDDNNQGEATVKISSAPSRPPIAIVSIPGLPESWPDEMTDAEREVAAGVLRGWSAQEIADERDVTVSTIENQLRTLYQKLRVADRAQLIRRLLGD